MAKSAADYEKELLDNIVDKTGKTLKEWISTIEGSSFRKNKEITKWLKTEYKLKHMYSSNIAAIYINGGKPVHSDTSGLLDSLFAGKEDKIPLYESLSSFIIDKINNSKLTPRKSYVQLDGKRCFAVIKINKKNLRLGLDLGEVPFDANVEKSKSLGAMPRFTHMIEITDESQINSKILPYIQQSYDRSQ